MVQKLAEIFESFGREVGQAIKSCGLLTTWGRVVDERVGKHTEAVKIKNRTLYVNASSSAWAQELSFLKSEFIKRFNQEAGQEVIHDIRFRAGG